MADRRCNNPGLPGLPVVSNETSIPCVFFPGSLSVEAQSPRLDLRYSVLVPRFRLPMAGLPCPLMIVDKIFVPIRMG